MAIDRISWNSSRWLSRARPVGTKCFGLNKVKSECFTAQLKCVVPAATGEQTTYNNNGRRWPKYHTSSANWRFIPKPWLATLAGGDGDLGLEPLTTAVQWAALFNVHAGALPSQSYSAIAATWPTCAMCIFTGTMNHLPMYPWSVYALSLSLIKGSLLGCNVNVYYAHDMLSFCFCFVVPAMNGISRMGIYGPNDGIIFHSTAIISWFFFFLINRDCCTVQINANCRPVCALYDLLWPPRSAPFICAHRIDARRIKKQQQIMVESNNARSSSQHSGLRTDFDISSIALQQNKFLLFYCDSPMRCGDGLAHHRE